MKTKIIIIVLSVWSVLSFLALIGSALNSEEWKTSLKQWEQAVKERDEQLSQSTTSADKLKAELKSLQDLYTSCQEANATLKAQGNNHSQNNPTSKPVTDQKKGDGCYTNDGFFAATTREYFDDATTYEVQKDTAALQRLMDAKVVIALKPGVKVHRSNLKILSGVMQIRPEGHTIKLWTNVEAVSCD